LRADPTAPFDVRTDPRRIGRAVAEALRVECSTLVIDQGDLTRADAFAAITGGDPGAGARAEALLAADALVGRIRQRLGAGDLLLVVSPTSPASADEAHLGVAIALGPGWPAGARLQSATTRRAGTVTLPDVAPTVLRHLGQARPPGMTGRPWFATPSSHDDRIDAAVDLDREAVFVDGIKSAVSTTFVIFQVLLYGAAIAVLARRSRKGPGLHRGLELAALAVVAFPPATYLAGAAPIHELTTGGFVALLLSIDAVVVGAALALAREPLGRLLAVAAGTTALIVADLVTGARLQFNTVFGYSPIIAGRFAGAGNITFAVLGVAGLVTGALIVDRWPRSAGALTTAALLFVAIVVVDGAPQFGSDIGGVLALVPALGITWLLLSGRRPQARGVALGLAAAVALLGVFLAIDLSRPPDERTHLARLWQDMTARGTGVVVDTIRRKAEANLRVFRSTVYTLFVPPALAVMAWLLLRPQGRWHRLAQVYPRARAGLIGGLILAVLGFAVNDSGIVVPAVVLSYLVPLALLLHLLLDRETP
jgi:hypothetical protein